METPVLLLLALSFFFIATLYSSVGFGGGSSYLAILALFIPDFLEIKTIALLCNLVVVAGGSYLFSKKGFFDKRKFLPLAVCSIPAAFLGATVPLQQHVFFIFLGVVLTLSGLLLILQLFAKPVAAKPVFSDSLLFNTGIGAGTGFLSGLVGIGGGILLSPLLNLLRWDTARKIAALSSFFILVNSTAGLLGQAYSGNFRINPPLLLALLLAVFLGGQLGTRLSLRIIHPAYVKTLTGVLVCYIGVKLVLSYSWGISI